MVPRTKLEQMFEDMVTARRYEERLQEEYLEGKQPAFDISAGPIPGELHLATGHEPAAVGVCEHLLDDDTVTAPHRPHHVAIAKGVEKVSVDVHAPVDGELSEIAVGEQEEFERGATLARIRSAEGERSSSRGFRTSTVRPR